MGNKSISDLQQARAIIKEVGEKHQSYVIDMLSSLTYYAKESKHEQQAQAVICGIEKEYALNVANVLFADKYEDIPDYIKKFS